MCNSLGGIICNNKQTHINGKNTDPRSGNNDYFVQTTPFTQATKLTTTISKIPDLLINTDRHQ